MARGAIAKSEIAKKILNTFEGAFLYNDGKEIRIPAVEEGELLQIKVSLTCAKENVNQGDDNIIPGESNIVSNVNEGINFDANFVKKETKVVEPTEEEKQNVRDLLDALGL